jgi:putative zinc finger/helix-turn-helix YgiT family protein
MMAVKKARREVTEPCYMCGGTAHEARRTRELFHGKISATINGAFMQCSPCGEQYCTPAQIASSDRQASLAKRREGKIWPSDIRRLREKRGFTQEMIERAFGLAAKAVNHWERGKCAPEGPTVALLRGLESGELSLEEIAAWRTGQSPDAARESARRAVRA